MRLTEDPAPAMGSWKISQTDFSFIVKELVVYGNPKKTSQKEEEQNSHPFLWINFLN